MSESDKPKTLNIVEIAKLAGSSKSAVSRVLHNQSGVSPETRGRIQHVIRVHNFRPSVFGRGLKGSKTGLIGVLGRFMGSGFTAEVIRGVDDEVKKRGGHLLISFAPGIDEYIDFWRTFAAGHQVDGLVLIAPPVDIFRHPIQVGDAPVVLCAAAPPAYADTWASAGAVTLDNKSAMEKLVNHVVVKGCKRLLHLSGQPDIYESHERSDLFIESAKEHKGVTTEVVQGAWTGELAEGVVHDYLETHRTWPDCILCFNDDIALGCLKTLRRKGIDVPSQIAVTGWDDIPFSDFADLTTVHLPMHEMGWEVGKILFERIESTDLKPKIKPPSMLEMPLKIRGSTALLPGTRQQEKR